MQGQQERSEMVGQDAECVLENTPCSRQMIVEDPVFVWHVADGEGFHHPFTQGESVNADHEVWKVVQEVEGQGSLLQLSLELGLVVNSTIRRSPVGPTSTHRNL